MSNEELAQDAEMDWIGLERSRKNWNHLVDLVIKKNVFSHLQAKPDQAYKPVQHHWFYRKDVEDKVMWRPFSQIDSTALEEAFNSPTCGPDTVVACEGGRYDVLLSQRERAPVYWRDNPAPVRRCSWFFKGTSDARFAPYPEDVADTLEKEFRLGIMTSTWNRKVSLADGESVVLHSATVMVHFLKQSSPDSWGNAPSTYENTERYVKAVYDDVAVTMSSWPFLSKRPVRRGVDPTEIDPGQEYLQPPDHLLLIVHGIGEPKKLLRDTSNEPNDASKAAARARAVRRGPDAEDVEEGEPPGADHLLMLIHGIGSVCDLKSRTVEEVVDDFRSISYQLVQSHYKSACEQGTVSRVEVLPISWHWNLHSEESGIDKRIAQITLESVPKMRGFTNDTLLDILFYTSPKFSQTIMNTVGSEMNRIYSLFKKRNPDFKGGVSLGGHSLGSLILFDLLCHQKPELPKETEEVKVEHAENTEGHPRMERQLSYVAGAAGTGQPCIEYPQLIFHPKSFFALGSPIGMFVCVRGLEALGEDFKLPTCPAFFNIFHPFDPVAYRVESLINPELTTLQPVQIPHHKGRKRMHLELKDIVASVGADLKQKLVESVRSTWDSFYNLATFTTPRQAALQERVKEVIEEELIREAEAERETEGVGTPPVHTIDPKEAEAERRLLGRLGRLNGGRRVDHVLQEAPFELFNEYIFAIASHLCYWESEDTMLLILKEIYSERGVEPDRQVPQQTLTVERPLQKNLPTDSQARGSSFTIGEGSSLTRQTLSEESEEVEKKPTSKK